MSVFQHLPELASSSVIYVIAFIISLSVVVFFHELGHFSVGRLCGLTIEVFSIGFGKELAGFTDRHGTRWRISALPLGGYVRPKGEMVRPEPDVLAQMSDAEKQGHYALYPAWKRFIFVAAGPLASFLLAAVLFAALALARGEDTLLSRVGAVTENSAAQAAGLQAGDLIVTIDRQPVTTFFDVMHAVADKAGVPLVLEIERGGTIIEKTVTPRAVEETTKFGIIRRGLMGVAPSRNPDDLRHRDFTLAQAAVEGVRRVGDIFVRSAEGVAGLISGRNKIDQVNGIIGIATVVGTAAQSGVMDFIFWTAVISASIGFLNLLPIPLLDGGHMVFYAIEMILRRPLSPRILGTAAAIGYALILSLAAVAFYNDVRNIFGHLARTYG